MTIETLPQDDPDLVEYKRLLIEGCHELFTSLEDNGNTRANMSEAIAQTLNRVQDIVVPYLDQMEDGDAAKFNRTMLLTLVLVRVMLRNPMYETPALTLQLRAEVEKIMYESRGMALSVND